MRRSVSRPQHIDRLRPGILRVGPSGLRLDALPALRLACGNRSIGVVYGPLMRALHGGIRRCRFLFRRPCLCRRRVRK